MGTFQLNIIGDEFHPEAYDWRGTLVQAPKTHPWHSTRVWLRLTNGRTRRDLRHSATWKKGKNSTPIKNRSERVMVDYMKVYTNEDKGRFYVDGFRKPRDCCATQHNTCVAICCGAWRGGLWPQWRLKTASADSISMTTLSTRPGVFVLCLWGGRDFKQPCLVTRRSFSWLTIIELRS